MLIRARREHGHGQESSLDAYVPGSDLDLPDLTLSGPTPAASPEVCRRVAASLADADSLLQGCVEAYDSGLKAAGALLARPSMSCLRCCGVGVSEHGTACRPHASRADGRWCRRWQPPHTLQRQAQYAGSQAAWQPPSGTTTDYNSRRACPVQGSDECDARAGDESKAAQAGTADPGRQRGTARNTPGAASGASCAGRHAHVPRTGHTPGRVHAARRAGALILLGDLCSSEPCCSGLCCKDCRSVLPNLCRLAARRGSA